MLVSFMTPVLNPTWSNVDWYLPDSISARTPKCTDYQQITGRLTTNSFIRLADLCNQRQKGTCEWIFENEVYTNWLFGGRRALYCVAPGLSSLGLTHMEVHADNSVAGAGKTFLA